MRFVLLAAMMLGFSVPPSHAGEDAFKSLLIEPAKTHNDRCRNGIVRHRITQWHKRAHIFVPETGPFDSVEKIMRDVVPEDVRRLEDHGCHPGYLWSFIACTGLDDPNFKSENIVPLGVTAHTDAEMAAIMRRCIDRIAEAGVLPAL